MNLFLLRSLMNCGLDSLATNDWCVGLFCGEAPYQRFCGLPAVQIASLSTGNLSHKLGPRTSRHGREVYDTYCKLLHYPEPAQAKMAMSSLSWALLRLAIVLS